MKYNLFTTVQLLVMTLLIGLIAGFVHVAASLYFEYQRLPVVHRTTEGACIKVTNFENGHAFGCPDVDVLLRRYRTEADK